MTSFAQRSRIPPPVYLVLAGLAVSFIPGVERFHLPPHLVFYGFLPPLVYAAAFVTAPREARENWRFILVLAFGLTAATLGAVGLVGWALLPALGAGGAFVLGAVLGPTDPVSATAVLGHTSAPERLRTILEGESLVNDGVGLVAFSIALTAVEHGGFSALDGLVKFLYVSTGGIVFGMLVAWLVERVRVRVHDARIEIPLSVLTPFAAYIPADKLHLSGILATVACGVYLGWRSGGFFKPEVRVQSYAFWNVLTFALTAVLFVLLGTQFRRVVEGASGRLILDPLLVFGVLTVVRFLWMLTAVRDTVRDRIVLGWSGMRGALSLAAALSIPVAVGQRNQILYLTFTTILAGLIVLALPLPWLLDLLGFEAGGADERAARGRLRGLDGLAARRAELRRMEHAGEISHSAARRIELDLDREETVLNRR